MTLNRTKVMLALGGNMPRGDKTPLQTLIQATKMLPSQGLVIRAVSRFFATPCFPAGAGPNYVNAAVEVTTDLDPQAVLAALHRIEHHFDRVRQQRWGMRTLDIDLLAYGQQVLPDRATYDGWRTLSPEKQATRMPEQLILPHPRLQDRAFVLVPLLDIAPDWVHPVLNQTTTQLHDALPDKDIRDVNPI